MTLSAAGQTFLEHAYGWTITEGLTLHEGENSTCVVTTSRDRIVVRRYRKKRYTPAEVSAELEWLAALKGTVPVVPALKTRDGTRYTVQGADSYAAFPYIAGNEPDPPTPEDFRRLGQLLRQLHGAAAHVLETRPEHWAGRQRPTCNLHIVAGALESLLQTLLLGDADKQRCVILAEQLRELYALCNPEKSFVHADLHFGNVLVNRNVWTLLDFDECGFGFPAFDLGTVRFHAVARGHEGWRAFFTGYGEPRPTVSELKLSTAMKIFYTAGKLPFRLDVPDVQKDAPGLIRKYLTMAEQALAET